MTLNEAYAPMKTFKTTKGEEFTRRLYSIDNLKHPESVFNSQRVEFLNDWKKKCWVNYAKNTYGNVWLEICIPMKKGTTVTKMSLDRFLSLVDKGDFIVMTPGFAEKYLSYYKTTSAD